MTMSWLTPVGSRGILVRELRCGLKTVFKPFFPFRTKFMRSILLSAFLVVTPTVLSVPPNDQFFGPPLKENPKESGEMFHINLAQMFRDEYKIILKAAERNGIKRNHYENLAILFAIRLAENGRKGIEFGVISNPRAIGREDEPDEVTLDRQAGWAAATIMKNRERWVKDPNKQWFITFLAKRYAPINAENDPYGYNTNWFGNVLFWTNKFMMYAPDSAKWQELG